jgi:hypothetical protein
MKTTTREDGEHETLSGIKVRIAVMVVRVFGKRETTKTRKTPFESLKIKTIEKTQCAKFS